MLDFSLYCLENSRSGAKKKRGSLGRVGVSEGRQLSSEGDLNNGLT